MARYSAAIAAWWSALKKVDGFVSLPWACPPARCGAQQGQTTRRWGEQPCPRQGPGWSPRGERRQAIHVSTMSTLCLWMQLRWPKRWLCSAWERAGPPFIHLSCTPSQSTHGTAVEHAERASVEASLQAAGHLQRGAHSALLLKGNVGLSAKLLDRGELAADWVV